MRPELWTADALAAAAGAQLDGAISRTITGFSIDTRSIDAGDVFVALMDARDGHEFVSAAFAGGAAAALVRTGYQRRPGDGALLRVDDPLRALERVGAAARARLAPEARVIAVTGSAGKTGTKEMLRACLSPIGATHAPEKSFNNHWGVPLTLARMPSATRFAVIEMGMNHAGEIRPLTRLARPHVAIVTNVLPVHVGNFEDGEIGIANAKAEVFEGLEAEGTAIILADSPHRGLLEVKARECGARVLAFGKGDAAEVRAVRLSLEPDGTRISASVRGREVAFRVGAPGEHLAINSLAVVAALDVLGLPLERNVAALSSISVPQGRGARSRLVVPGGEILLIDESYNANPASMRAALAAMATVPRGQAARRLAVLGDMLELGGQAAQFHLDLKSAVEDAGADVVFAAGPNMRHLFDVLPASMRGHWAATSSGLVEPVLAAVRAGDVVMIKGSHGSRMAPIVEALKQRYAGAQHNA